MTSWRIIEGDCVEAMRAMPEASVDAVVCDPPYALGFMSKQWDQFRSSGSEWSSAHATGKDWKGQERERPARLTMRSYHYTCKSCGRQQHQHDDAQCAEPDYERVMHEPTQLRAFQAWCEAWAIEALRVLKPGGHLLAFGGTRTHHRLTCAIEDAGFEIRDCLAWLYGSGFPKSLNVGKAMNPLPWRHPGDFRLREAAAWSGHGSALKPGHEPIVLARKPLTGTVAGNVLAHGTGALNVDGCRIDTGDDLNGGAYSGGARRRDEYSGADSAPGAVPLSRLNRGIGDYEQPSGRWPANVVLDPEAAALLDEMTGELTSGQPGTMRLGRNAGAAYGAESRPAGTPMTGFGDTGGASRFFYVAKADSAERNTGLHGQRNPHPTVKPVALMRWLCRLITPPGGTILDPFTGSGTTGIAALREGFAFVGIEREAEYVAIARARIIGDAPLINGATELAA